MERYPSQNSFGSGLLGVLRSTSALLLLLWYGGTQVSRLEAEGQQMQATLSQNQQVIKSLERRVAGLESEVHDNQQRVGGTACLRDRTLPLLQHVTKNYSSSTSLLGFGGTAYLLMLDKHHEHQCPSPHPNSCQARSTAYPIYSSGAYQL